MCAHAHLAPLAGDDPVVDPGRLVPADFARDHFDLCWKRKSRRSARGHGYRDASFPLSHPQCSLPFPSGQMEEAKCQALLSKVSVEAVVCFGGWPGVVAALWGQKSSCMAATCSALQVVKLQLPPSRLGT